MSARRDDAMSAEDREWGAYHKRCEEYDDWQRHAREESRGDRAEGVLMQALEMAKARRSR